jgi:hypothetical protein
MVPSELPWLMKKRKPNTEEDALLGKNSKDMGVLLGVKQGNTYKRH